MAERVTRSHHEAEALAAGLPPLMVAAERVATTVSQGVHGRRRVGQGETFWQFRRYEPGDTVQHIDWRQRTILFISGKMNGKRHKVYGFGAMAHPQCHLCLPMSWSQSVGGLIFF